MDRKNWIVVAVSFVVGTAFGMALHMNGRYVLHIPENNRWIIDSWTGRVWVQSTTGWRQTH